MAILLSACQLDAQRSPFLVFAPPTDTPTPTATDTPTPTNTATPTPTATSTPTPTPTLTPTSTLPPTATPIPSDRLALAQQAYDAGHYELARTEFDALLNDPGSAPYEQQYALHWRGRSELELGDTSAAIATLKQFLQQYPTDTQVRAAQFNLGRAYELSGQTQEAVDAYLGTIIPDDPINVYLYERIGDLRLKTGAYTETVAAYRAGIDSTDDPGFQVHLREGIAQAELMLNDNPDGAIAQYEDILDIAKIDAYRAKVLRLIGDTYLAAENTETAYDYYQQAVNTYPEAYDSYLALVKLVNADIPVDDFQRGVIDYHARAYQPAIAAFEQYLAEIAAEAEAEEKDNADPQQNNSNETPDTKNPTPEIQNPKPVLSDAQRAQAEASTIQNPDEALWLMALSWQALGQYNSAILTFQTLIDQYPDSPHRGEAHLEMGKTLIDQGSYNRAKTVLRNFAEQQPDDPLAPEALFRAARLDMSAEEFAQARTHLLALAETYPTSPYAADSLFWAGQSAYQMEDYEGAIEAWALLAEDYPKSSLLTFGSYWRARSLRALGRADEAEAALEEMLDLPIDYYVLRARDWLMGHQSQPVPFKIPGQRQLAAERIQAEAWLREWLDIADDVDDLSAIGEPLQSDPAFQRGDALLKLGLHAEALTELDALKNDWQDDPLAMYQLAVYFNEKGFGRLSILSAGQLIFLSPAEGVPEETPVYIQRLYYPVLFADTILAEAEAQNVDPAMIAAIIRQESLFEKSAESVVGARGLMQVMPGTGEYVAERSGFENFDVDQLWLPYISIKMGAWYINQQLGIFEGNQFAALAAYNAGPGNVLNWIETSDDLDIFVESIPFRESRLYIRRIYVNLEAYRRIYGETRQ